MSNPRVVAVDVRERVLQPSVFGRFEMSDAPGRVAE